MNTFVNYSFAGVGLCLLLGSAYFYQDTQNFLKDSTMTKGTVVENVKSMTSGARGKPRRAKYNPVITFETQDGSTIEFKSAVGSNKPDYKKGDSLDVLYQPSSPQDARISGFFSVWGMSSILAGLGFLFFATGLFGIVFGNRKAK